MRMPDRALSLRGLPPMAPDSALLIRSSWQEPVTPFTAPWCKTPIISTFLVGLTQVQREPLKLSRTPSRREYGGRQSSVFIACEQSTVNGALNFRAALPCPSSVNPATNNQRGTGNSLTERP